MLRHTVPTVRVFIANLAAIFRPVCGPRGQPAGSAGRPLRTQPDPGTAASPGPHPVPAGRCLLTWLVSSTAYMFQCLFDIPTVY
jgi:hypothetical protein